MINNIIHKRSGKGDMTFFLPRALYYVISMRYNDNSYCRLSSCANVYLLL